MNILIYVVLSCIAIESASAAVRERTVKKRQIYREQVLPHAGGKIPDTAFQTDRLILNRLQKEGIAIPDGVIFEQRTPQVHQYYDKTTRAVYKVATVPDNRYTYSAGRFHYHETPSLDTTYLLPQIHNYPLRAPPAPLRPKLRPLHLPNSIPIERKKPSPPPKKSYFYIAYDTKHPKGSTNKLFSTYDTFYPRNTFPSSSISWSQFNQNYIASQLIDDFDDFFNSFNLRNIKNVERNNELCIK